MSLLTKGIGDIINMKIIKFEVFWFYQIYYPMTPNFDWVQNIIGDV